MNQKPLWQRLEDAQYNKYKPRLDRMLERYGDMFEMDIYETVTCTDSEYKDWQLACNAGADNFAIRLRRDELELFMQKIAEPVLGECKVYVADGNPSILGMDAEIETFFTYEFDLVKYAIWVPYTENYQSLADALIDAIVKLKYKIHVDLMFVEVEHYADVSRDWRYGIPDKYKYRVEILYHGDYKMGPSYYGNYGKIWTEGEGVNKQ